MNLRRWNQKLGVNRGTVRVYSVLPVLRLKCSASVSGIQPEFRNDMPPFTGGISLVGRIEESAPVHAREPI